MNIKDRNSRIAFNTITLYIRTFIVMIISFLASRIMLEQLGVEDYGLNNLISGVVAMFGFLNMSMGTAVQRFFNVEESKADGVSAKKIYGSAMLIHVVIGLITLLLLEVFALFFLCRLNIPAGRTGVAQWVFQFSSLTLIMGILAVPAEAFLRSKEEFSKLAIIEIVEAVLRVVILYLLYISPYDKLWTIAFLTFLLKFLCNMAVWIIAIKLYGDVAKPYLYYEKTLFVKMISFSLLLLLSIASSMAYWQGLVMMINVFFGVAINAAYGIGHQIKVAVDRFLFNFKQSTVPQLMSAQASGDDNRLKKLIYFSTKLTFVMSLMIVVPVVFETDFILKVWLKNPPDFTTRFVQLGFVISVLSSFSYYLKQAIHATGRVTGFSIVTSLNYVVNLAAIYLMLKLGFGFYVTMYVSIVMEIISIIITFVYSKITFDFNVGDFIYRIVLRSLLFCAIMVGCFMALNYAMDDGWLRLGLNLALSMLLSFGSLYILMNSDERYVVLGYLDKIKSKILRKN